jgi:hypothetical protein
MPRIWGDKNTMIAAANFMAKFCKEKKSHVLMLSNITFISIPLERGMIKMFRLTFWKTKFLMD